MTLLAVLPTAKEIFTCPTFWALIAGVLGLLLLLPARMRYGNLIGGILMALAGGLLAADLPRLGNWVDQGVFWMLALVTLSAAVATIASQSPVYSAIWFAMSLLGTAGLFLFQGAQFLGVATVVVYAGAIVVTFLFVIMLAKPEGYSSYDRISWGGAPKLLGVVMAGLLVGMLTFMLEKVKGEALRPPEPEKTATADSRRHDGTMDAQIVTPADHGGVLDPRHTANLGRRLFSQHLISVELAGTLLLVALVGAVAIALHGRPRLAERIEEALR